MHNITILALGLIFSSTLLSQVGPSCKFQYRLSNRTTDPADNISTFQLTANAGTTASINNKNCNASAWVMSYSSEGFSALSIQLEDSQNQRSGTFTGPTTWAAWEGTAIDGSNPSTTNSSYYSAKGFYPWVRVNLASSTGTGSIDITLTGWQSPALLSSSGGGGGGAPSGPAGGMLGGTYPNPTVNTGAGLTTVGNNVLVDSSVIPRKDAPFTMTAGSTITVTQNATTSGLKFAGSGIFSGRTAGLCHFDQTSLRFICADGVSLNYYAVNPGTTIGDLFTCTTTATPCLEGKIAAGAAGLFLRANGAENSLSWASPTASQITNVFDVTAVNTLTDQSTPLNPSSGFLKVYSKFGKFCSLSSAGVENCVGDGVTVPGADTQIIFNNAGVLGANGNLYIDGNGFNLHGNSFSFLRLDGSANIKQLLGNTFINGLELGSDNVVGFYSAGNIAGAPDTGLSRDTAGVIDFGNGTAQDKTGSWKAVNGTLSGILQFGLYTVSSGTGKPALPTCNGAAEGSNAGVVDLLTPTFLAVAVGGGAVHGKVYCNGTNWVTD